MGVDSAFPLGVSTLMNNTPNWVFSMVDLVMPCIQGPGPLSMQYRLNGADHEVRIYPTPVRVGDEVVASPIYGLELEGLFEAVYMESLSAEGASSLADVRAGDNAYMVMKLAMATAKSYTAKVRYDGRLVKVQIFTMPPEDVEVAVRANDRLVLVEGTVN